MVELTKTIIKLYQVIPTIEELPPLDEKERLALAVELAKIKTIERAGAGIENSIGYV